MAAEDFHDKRFDEGTLTKLEIFELYAREWIPVFLSSDPPTWRHVRIFDFFAGPGTDSTGVLGSPLRLMRQLKEYRHLPGWRNVSVSAHFFDEDQKKIQRLTEIIQQKGFHLSGVTIDSRPLAFDLAFRESLSSWRIEAQQN